MTRRATRQDVRIRTGFAARLHEALCEDDWTTEKFAREIDRTLRTVQRWRAGDSEPDGRDLVLVAQALRRDPSWFYDSVEEAA